MTDWILVDGDIAEFLPSFGAAIVNVQPGTLTGSGPATLQGKSFCVDGDEDSVSVPGCTYMAPPFVIPGSGTLEIAALSGDQVATKDRSGGKAILLVGQPVHRAIQGRCPGHDAPAHRGARPDSRVFGHGHVHDHQ